MDTNGHEWTGGNHEKHEKHERGRKNHEWTPMDIISCNNFMVFQMIWNQTS